VIGSHASDCSRLWISYLWTRREEKDFTYLASEMKSADVEATYDSIELQQDFHMWQRIEQRLLSIDFDGWMYVLTHQVLTHKKFADQLIAAIDQILMRKGPDFPMVGLLHGIAAQYLPSPLKARPCLSLEDPAWRQLVSDTLRKRAPSPMMPPLRQDTRFNWRIHPCWAGNPSATAIEVGTKFEVIRHWRFAIPRSMRTAEWGSGAAGGGKFQAPEQGVAMGYGRFGLTDVAWFGATGSISRNNSAYMVFSGALPDLVCFGSAETAMGPPRVMEIVRLGQNSLELTQ
jgi:hypothetical protein